MPVPIFKQLVAACFSIVIRTEQNLESFQQLVHGDGIRCYNLKLAFSSFCGGRMDDQVLLDFTTLVTATYGHTLQFHLNKHHHCMKTVYVYQTRQWSSLQEFTHHTNNIKSLEQNPETKYSVIIKTNMIANTEIIISMLYYTWDYALAEEEHKAKSKAKAKSKPPVKNFLTITSSNITIHQHFILKLFGDEPGPNIRYLEKKVQADKSQSNIWNILYAFSCLPWGTTKNLEATHSQIDIICDRINTLCPTNSRQPGYSEAGLVALLLVKVGQYSQNGGPELDCFDWADSEDAASSDDDDDEQQQQHKKGSLFVQQQKSKMANQNPTPQKCTPKHGKSSSSDRTSEKKKSNQNATPKKSKKKPNPQKLFK